MPGLIDNAVAGLQSTGANASPSLYEGDAAALAGKDFPANYFYNVGSSSVSSSSVNGVYTNNGSVSGFSSQSSISGTVQVVDAVSGKITIGGQAFTIMGSTADGQYLVLGKEVVQSIGGISFNSIQVSALLANDGNLPQGTLNFSTSNGYNAPNPVCFVRGTLIKTAEGYKPIEDIAVGELLETSSGELLPVKWLGHRTVGCKGFSSGNSPVRIRAGALGASRPFKDLLVSPGHRIHFTLLDDVFVTASSIINGSTIVNEDVSEVEYWHVECDRHAAIFANGATAETYIEADNRTFFESEPVADLHPELRENAQGGECFPLIADGPVLDIIRRLIEARAVAMGWTIQSVDADVALNDAGRIQRPYFRNESLMTFLMDRPDGDVILSSAAEVPATINPNATDTRSLGIQLFGGFILGSCGTGRQLDLAAMEWTGLHSFEEGADLAWRWTNGAAVLPHSLFEGMQGPVTIRLDTPAESRRMWLAPEVPVALAS